jgi:undecaprenyl-diphosphatase
MDIGNPALESVGASDAQRPTPATRTDGPRFLHARRSMRPEARLAGHPIVAFLVVALLGLIVLAALTVLGGWLLKTYALPEHGLGHADEHVNVWLAQHRDGTRNDVSFWLSGIGDVLAIPGLVGITAIAAMILRRWRVAAFIVAAIAVEAATYRITTWVIHRDRPHVPRLDDLPADASYYSGHTAASIAVYGGIAMLITSRVQNRAARIVVWSIAVAVPVLVALSRMYRGMHHPTDVAAAVLVGLGSLAVAIAAARAADAANRASEGER